MKKTLIYLPEDLHEGLREIAFRRRTTVSELIRRATEVVYEDELDAVEAERGLEDYLADPSASISLEEFVAKRRSAVRT